LEFSNVEAGELGLDSPSEETVSETEGLTTAEETNVMRDIL
jgi:hypothetical protein